MDSELQEKDFIKKPQRGDSFSIVLWISIFVVIVALLWGGKSWYWEWLSSKIKASPFLEVTNREFSLFLGQFPEYMRVNARQKTGYLPGFEYLGGEGLNPEMADKFVVAPPEILFLYHTWHRLLLSDNMKAILNYSIPKNLFTQFLEQNAGWTGMYWGNAPSGFVELTAKLNQMPDDLKELPITMLPIEVRLAFQGWKNFFKDGESINQLRPTYGEVTKFLQDNPHYARNYWRNIVMATKPKYLESISEKQSDAIVPEEELTSFLKVALFNQIQN